MCNGQGMTGHKSLSIFGANARLKSPAKNILVENIYCNLSGGCAMGSLGADTDISDITYKNIYTWNSNQMMMIKSNGGSGTVSNVVFENFIGKQQALPLSFSIQAG